MLPQAPGPDVRRVRTHGPPLASLFLCVPLWFFVFLAVEGLALWACTVIAAQREACPNFQAFKLLSFHCASCVRQHAKNLH